MEEQSTLDVDRLCTLIESMLLVSSEPLAVERIKEIVLAEAPSTDPALVERAATSLVERYADAARPLGRGFRVDVVADGLQLRTPADSAPFLRRLLAARPPKLTKPAMETLAVIAYRQPVTKPEIESIRGVDVAAVLKALLDRDLIRIIGKSDDLGRPILYGTTKRFLELFGLRTLGALPTLREYHELDDAHQQHVDELYESQEPKISDLAAKAAFLVERRHDADLDALAEAEASVAAADERTEAVLAGDLERPTDAPPSGVAATPGASPAAEAAPTDEPQAAGAEARDPTPPPAEGAELEGRPTEPPAAQPTTGRPRKARRSKAAGDAGAIERPTDPPAPPVEDSAPTEDLAPSSPPKKTKLRKKRGADQEANDE